MRKITSREDVCDISDILDYCVYAITSNLESQPTVHLQYLRLQMKWNNAVNNSHCAPIGGSRNFGNKNPLKPSNYPGYQGRIWIAYTGPDGPDGFGSTPLESTCLHSGSGGYGIYDNTLFRARLFLDNDGYLLNGQRVYPLSWDGKLFIDDFPGIKTQMLLEGKITPAYSFDLIYDRGTIK